MLRKGIQFQWYGNCQNAFEQLKKTLVPPLLLTYPDFDQPFVSTTDVSSEALGAVLSQGPPGKYKLIAYPAERRNSTTKHELLAIVRALKNFGH